MSIDQRPILIAGGGIGGFAAALALTKQGFKVKVFEQAPEIGEIGAGIQLGQMPSTHLMHWVLVRLPVAKQSTLTIW